MNIITFFTVSALNWAHSVSNSFWNGRQIKIAKNANASISSHKPSAPLKETASISKHIPSVTLKDTDYGEITLNPFTPTWLSDYPQIVEHLEAEHLLHVKGLDEKGEGLTWHTSKFSTDINPQFNPEARIPGAEKGGFQMKLGYFIIPTEKMDVLTSLSLSEPIAEELKVYNSKKELIGYRFYVHPEAYDHYRSLHRNPAIKYVEPKDSDAVFTPTSSYRSLATRRVKTNAEGQLVPVEGSLPFVVKLGVGGSILGSDRWLSHNEIERSVQCQAAFDGMEEKIFQAPKHGGQVGSEFSVFGETMGLMLKEIDHYPPTPIKDGELSKPSGILIREFPKELLSGKVRIFSMAALISPERIKSENKGVGTSVLKGIEGFEHLPLIYEVIEASIRAGLVTSAEDFVQKYLVEAYIDAIEGVTFLENMTLEPHSQNLCMALNPDLTPKGFVYRDHGGIWVDIATRGLQGKGMEPFHREKRDQLAIFKSKGAISKGYVGPFSWFYRYQVVMKTLNLLTRLPDFTEYMPPLPGAPSQIGCDSALKERNLHRYMVSKLATDKSNELGLKALSVLSLTFEQYTKTLTQLDLYYAKKMNRYFDLQKISHEFVKGSFPAAEGGSPDEKRMLMHQGFLGKYRFYKIKAKSLRMNIDKIPSEVRKKIDENAITSFSNQELQVLRIQEILFLQRGIAYIDDQSEIVGFSPFANSTEKEWLKKRLEAENQRK